MDLPKFLSREGNALVYNQEKSTLVYYIPANYFNDGSKTPIAYIDGQYIYTIGLFNWAIIDSNGRKGQLKLFSFPTSFICKPGSIEKVKNLKLDNTEESDYVLLKFKAGDEAISQIRVPQLIDNVEMFFKMAIMTAKIPSSVPYDEIWKLFFESAKLNGFSYNMNIQLFNIMISSLCRDKNDISKQFSETDMENMNDYSLIDIRMVPKFISPYAAITSENWDESVRAAILMKDEDDTAESPLEKVVTM